VAVVIAREAIEALKAINRVLRSLGVRIKVELTRDSEPGLVNDVVCTVAGGVLGAGTGAYVGASILVAMRTIVTILPSPVTPIILLATTALGGYFGARAGHEVAHWSMNVSVVPSHPTYNLLEFALLG
jgi:hypothetical protein